MHDSLIQFDVLESFVIVVDVVNIQPDLFICRFLHVSIQQLLIRRLLQH